MSHQKTARIISTVIDHHRTFTSYPTRDSFALFATTMIKRWARGDMDDVDFRQRLAALSVCEIDADREAVDREIVAT